MLYLDGQWYFNFMSGLVIVRKDYFWNFRNIIFVENQYFIYSDVVFDEDLIECFGFSVVFYFLLQEEDVFSFQDDQKSRKREWLDGVEGRKNY